MCTVTSDSSTVEISISIASVAVGNQIPNGKSWFLFPQDFIPVSVNGLYNLLEYTDDNQNNNAPRKTHTKRVILDE